MKKLTSWLLIVALSTTVLTACTPDSPAEGTTAPTTTTVATTTEVDSEVTTEPDDATEETSTRSTEEPDTEPSTVTVDPSTDETTVADPTTTIPDETEPAMTEDGSEGTDDPADTEASTDPDGTDDWDGGSDLGSFIGGLESLQINKRPDGSVEMIMPADLVDDETIDALNAGDSEFGDVDYTQNPDGSVTIILTEEQHQVFLQDMREATVSMFDDMKESFATFRELEISDDMQQFTVMVDGDTWSDSDAFGFLGFSITSVIYQLYDGVDRDDMKFEVKVIDDETGEVIHEMNEMMWG